HHDMNRGMSGIDGDGGMAERGAVVRRRFLSACEYGSQSDISVEGERGEEKENSDEREYATHFRKSSYASRARYYLEKVQNVMQNTFFAFIPVPDEGAAR